MKRLLLQILTVATALAAPSTACANDGVFFTSGNFLVPVHETDISVAREALTINIGRDSLATVGVRYEFVNHSLPKIVRMAFEASAPHNDLSPIDRRGAHPRIKDFTVSMNGTPLPYSNAVVACFNYDGGHRVDFTPLDMNRWKGYGEVPDSILPDDGALYNAAADSIVPFAYAYYFDAPFQSGANTVSHTYRYRMSYNVTQRFVIPYWLTPAVRWANRRVDDFTLNITSDDCVAFCLTDSVFRRSEFRRTSGGRVYHLRDDYGNRFVFAELSQGDTLMWHGLNFRPEADMTIASPMWELDSRVRSWQTEAKVVADDSGDALLYLADSGDAYFVRRHGEYCLLPKKQWRLEEYKAADGRGWLTVDTGAATRVNIRKKPSDGSRVLTTVDAGGAEAYPCLGMVTRRRGDEYHTWYKIKVGGVAGYVSQDLMVWNAVRE